MCVCVCVCACTQTSELGFHYWMQFSVIQRTFSETCRTSWFIQCSSNNGHCCSECNTMYVNI